MILEVNKKKCNSGFRGDLSYIDVLTYMQVPFSNFVCFFGLMLKSTVNS